MDINSTITLNNGTKIPRLGIGCWRSPSGDVTKNSVLWALEAGYRHIDTAAIYKNEADVGNAIKESVQNMDMTYKILWIDDAEDYVDSTKELVVQAIQNRFMDADIESYSDYDEFKSEKLENFDATSFDFYDLILMDFALSGTTGDAVIRELRSKEIYTDIVFYSSDKENMESSLKNSDQLNGVFLADRANLLEIIGRVVQKNLKREYRISNIRGLIMDSTSEFDYICQSTTIALFEKLSSEQQDVIVRKAKEYVESAASKSGQNFEGLNKKVGKSFIKNAIQSVEYVMDNKDRYALMGLIVKFFDDGPIAQEDFSQKYSDELIKPRNKLAHAKLVYGKCHQKLHPIKNRSIPSCDGKCDSCSNEYDMEKCESLRAAIYNYYKVFQNIEKKTNELVPLE